MEKEQDILTLLADDLEAYLNRYTIGELVECSFLKKGLNYSYLVISTTGKYIFRIYRNQWRCVEDILYEVDALTQISRHDISISVPIDTISGEYIQKICISNESHYGVLFSYAQGEIPNINEDSSYKLGEILAKIHKCTEDFHSRYKRSYNIDLLHLIDEPMNRLSSVIEIYLPKESCEFIYNLANYLKQTISNLDLELGFCHGDLHDWNVHSYDNLYTVFDFDCCGNGFIAYDLSVFWWNLRVNYPEKEVTCWEAFKRGYLYKKGLKTIDMASIELFVIARKYWLASVLLENTDVFGTGWINEIGLNTFLNQIKDDVRDFNIIIR